jgi:hypothetical protein
MCVAATAYEYDQPGKEWIKKLIEFVRYVATEKPRIKIFGQWTCFMIRLSIDISFNRYMLRTSGHRACHGWDMCSQHA